ncbi:MAG: sugar phosphate isomerase/epimerase family protein [Caldilineaceae bacterium]
MTTVQGETRRPILISVMQFEDTLKAGTQTVFDVIETAKQVGANGVELRRETWGNWQQELTAAREQAASLGLLVAYATHVTLFSADEQGQQVLHHDIDAASTLGSPILRVFQGPAPEDDQDERWDAARAVVAYAASRNVVIALENYVGMPGGKLAEIQRVLNLIEHPALGTNIDIGNYNQHGQDVVEAIQAIGDRAVYAHIKDKTGVSGEPPIYLGGGQMPLPEILAALDALPQSFPYCFEFRGGDDPQAAIKTSLAYLQQL